MNVRQHIILNIKVAGVKKFYVIFTPETTTFIVQDFRENSIIITMVPHIVRADRRLKQF
jgi:hypothetical protein